MLYRVTCAALRAILVAILFALPGLTLSGFNRADSDVTLFLSLCAALFVFAEYAASVPSLIEFRDAAPYNRIRFGALLLIVTVTLQVFGGAASAAGGWLWSVGDGLGRALDLPGLPVNLLVATMTTPEDAHAADLVRAAASLSLTISFLFGLAFLGAVRLGVWPAKAAFNVWVNLPTFDPTSAGDVVIRLRRDARLNIALGLVLPTVGPIALRGFETLLGPVAHAAAPAQVWIIAGWAFLPLMLVMRGLAMQWLSRRISGSRRRATIAGRAPGRTVTP